MPAATPSASAGAAPALVLDRHRVYILPTAQGLSFAAALLVMLVGSINYNSSLGHMLVFLLMSLGLVSLLHTWRNLAGLSVRAGRAPAVFAGEPARYQICLHNPDRNARRSISLLYQSGRDPRGRPRRAALTTQVPARGIHCVELTVPTRSRGRHALGRISVATRFPVGLFRAWSPFEPGVSCLVYPRPSGTLRLPQRVRPELAQGSHRGEGQDDFSGFRDYAEGDSPRRVHWKAAARDQGLVVKLFAGGAQGNLELGYEDAGPNPDPEARLSQLCRWVLEADRLGYRYALSLPGRQIPAERGEGHLRSCLRALALYGTADG